MGSKNLKLVLGTCALALQLSTSFTVFAREGGAMDGGGGVVIKNNKELKLLQEVGILIEGQPTERAVFDRPYRIDPETQKELAAIFATLRSRVAMFGTLENKVLGEKGTILIKAKINEVGYSRIKSEYKKLLSQNGHRIEDDKLVLAAFSQTDIGKTYLLPDFFLLNPRQKAMILIHELSMRQRISGAGGKEIPRDELLRRALILDGQITQILQDKYELLPAMKALGSIHQLSPQVWVLTILSALEKELGRPVALEEISSGIQSRGPYPEGDIPVSAAIVYDTQVSMNLKQDYATLFQELPLTLWKPAFKLPNSILVEGVYEQLLQACLKLDPNRYYLMANFTDYTIIGLDCSDLRTKEATSMIGIQTFGK